MPLMSWYTNVAAPYRLPVWDHIEKTVDLRVHLTEDERSLRREGRRPADWWQATSDRYVSIPNITVRKGERSFYLARAAPLIPRGTDAVLIGAWESPLYWQVLAEAKLKHIRTVGFYESTLRSNRHRQGPVASARAAFFRSLDAVVVPGVAAEEAVASFGVHTDRVFRGFNAVDVTRFRDAAVLDPVEHGPGHRFVFVGQMIERKNPELALAAFDEVRGPGDKMTFIGDGERLDALRHERARRGMEGVVSFLGSIDNKTLAHVLHTFDTLVLPSAEEVWGLVVNEALAAGLGAIVSSHAGVAPSVRKMERVFVADPTTHAFMEAMRAARSWGSTPVESPEILQHSPQRFADVFLEALLPSSRQKEDS